MASGMNRPSVMMLTTGAAVFNPKTPVCQSLRIGCRGVRDASPHREYD